jgi:hypothetical protein
MAYYEGDITGDFVWEYDSGDEVFRYEQDPFFLQKYGAHLWTKRFWEGCGCYVEDNNLPYCMRCYDSAAEQKEHTNVDDLKNPHPSYEMRFFKEDFDEQVRPWLQANELNAQEYIPRLTFINRANTVVCDEWECKHNQDNTGLVQEYCILKQIEYYFDHNEEPIGEECCVFQIFLP